MVLTESDKLLYESIYHETLGMLMKGSEPTYMEEQEARAVGTKLYMREKCVTDLYFLGAYVLGLDNVRDKRTGRKRLDESVHRPMAQMLERDEDTMQMEPRGHLKSCWMKYAIVQRVLQNPNNRVALWTKTKALGEKQLKIIKGYFEHPTLKELFEEVCGVGRKKWVKDTASEMLIQRVDRSEQWEQEEQENQVEVWGIDSTVVGHHYDYHFYDDIIDEDSVTTPEQLEKVREWWSMCQAIKEPSGVEKLIGTRYHYHDIYGEIMEEEYFEPGCVRITQAIYDGKPYYSFFTMKDLDKIRKRMGERRFMLQYMNTVVMESDRIFIPPYPTYVELPSEPEYYMTVDPALGSTYSNKTGICVACIGKSDRRLHVVEAIQVDQPSNKLAEIIVDYLFKYRPKKIGIEFGLQVALETIIRMLHATREAAVGESVPLVMEEIPTRIGRMNKVQKIERTLGSLVRENRVVFSPFGMKPLYRQMDMLNPNTPDSNEDDIIDAVSMMTFVAPIFPQSRWWMKPSYEDHSGRMTVEMLIEKLKEKERTWDRKMAV